ncbi:MAG: hypothetical protein F6K62_01945 [Sphaerospermopsis sp. SIO1G2]|nr:hypothetical protein [Sphaerospermopsis sp. SIO1G1]NET69838.1 hypothetical protein [Sphaerospermopsis sp. SIO1G2]
MSQLEKFLKMAEDELTEYSTDGRKREKLRQKINLSLSLTQQKQMKDELLATMPSGIFAEIVENQRQTVALPFWGIAGLGLLFGISINQPVCFLASILGTVMAFRIQKWGWQLQANRLLLRTLEDIETRVTQARQ